MASLYLSAIIALVGPTGLEVGVCVCIELFVALAKSVRCLFLPANIKFIECFGINRTSNYEILIKLIPAKSPISKYTKGLSTLQNGSYPFPVEPVSNRFHASTMV